MCKDHFICQSGAKILMKKMEVPKLYNLTIIKIFLNLNGSL